jgi:hypothetical protein
MYMMTISSYNCLNVCKIQYRTWIPRDQGKAALFWRKTVCSTSNRNPTPYSLYDCIAVSAHNNVSISLLGTESRDVYFFQRLNPNSLKLLPMTPLPQSTQSDNGHFHFIMRVKSAQAGDVGLHSNFWAQMALASLVAISRPKKVLISRAHPFQCPW